MISRGPVPSYLKMWSVILDLDFFSQLFYHLHLNWRCVQEVGDYDREGRATILNCIPSYILHHSKSCWIKSTRRHIAVNRITLIVASHELNLMNRIFVNVARCVSRWHQWCTCTFLLSTAKRLCSAALMQDVKCSRRICEHEILKI